MSELDKEGAAANEGAAEKIGAEKTAQPVSVRDQDRDVISALGLDAGAYGAPVEKA